MSTPSQPSAERGALVRQARKKRMLVIVNPHATTVSERLVNLVVYALQSRFEVEVQSTRAPSHATAIGREACDGGYDVVVAFGGDGTLNEVANGLAGTDIPVAILPGGSTNVVCRTLGIPVDVVDATERLLSDADRLPRRRIDLGLLDGRHFVFAAGAGLDATTVRRVDASPRLKAAAGPYFYSWAALGAYYRHYLVDPVRIRVRTGDLDTEGVTVLAQNSDPFTYFGRRPVRVCPEVAIDDGGLGLAVLERAAQRDVATLVPRLLFGRRSGSSHGRVTPYAGVTESLISSAPGPGGGSGRPFPVQVDGDYIGERREAHIRVAPRALTVVTRS